MSTTLPRSKANTESSKSATQQADGGVADVRPHRKMFFILLALFGVWIVVLLAIYFSSVYPMRHP